jgi:hypothetical protein
MSLVQLKSLKELTEVSDLARVSDNGYCEADSAKARQEWSSDSLNQAIWCSGLSWWNGKN